MEDAIMISRSGCISSDEESVDSSFSVLRDSASLGPRYQSPGMLPPSLTTASMNETKQGERYEQRVDIIEVFDKLNHTY